MILKIGTIGNYVNELQEFLDITIDGIFGKGTERSVKEWQADNGLVADGIVGPATWNCMGLATTDLSETYYSTENGLIINKHFLPISEYKQGPINPEYMFLHHTAGWQNPYKTIDHWGRDSRGAVSTEFIIGGPSVKGDDDSYDGDVVQSFPAGNYGWHLGKNGSQSMHKNSVGIEVNNFAYLTKGGYTKNGIWITKNPNSYYTYSGVLADDSQIVILDKPFRGHSTWHKYSDMQIESLKNLILFIGDRDNIDIIAGLPTWIKAKGADAFEWNKDAYYGKAKGLLTHSNIRKDKSDMFPQQELMDMLISL